MALKTVTLKLTDASNTPQAYASVKAVLSAQAVIASTQEIAPTQIATLTAADGTASLSLEANADLTPSTTYYTISVGTSWICTAIVPQGAGPYKLEDIMAAAPVPAPTVGYQAGSDAVFRSVTGLPSGPYVASNDTFAAGTFGGKVAVGGSQRFTNYRPQSISTGTGNPGGSGVQHAPFGVEVDDSTVFVDTNDPAMYLGYNAGATGLKKVAAEPYLAWVVESDYNDGTAHKVETYFEYKSPDGLISYRPLFFQFDRSQAGAANMNKSLSMFIAGNPFQVVSPDGTINARISTLDALGLPGQINFYPSTVIGGNTILTVNAKTGSIPQISMRVNDADIFYFGVATLTQGQVSVAGNRVMGWYKSGTGGAVDINVSDNGAGLTVVGGSAAGGTNQKTIVARAGATQAANLQEWQNSGGTPLALITNAGDITTVRFKTALNGALNEFQLGQNSYERISEAPSGGIYHGYNFKSVSGWKHDSTGPVAGLVLDSTGARIYTDISQAADTVVAPVLSLATNGDGTMPRGIGFWGHAAVGSQPATPVTLADVIAVIRGCGLAA